MRQKIAGEWIQLALYDPCGDFDEPIRLVDRPREDTPSTRQAFRQAIADYNLSEGTEFVLAVCHVKLLAYVRHTLDASCYKPTKPGQTAGG